MSWIPQEKACKILSASVAFFGKIAVFHLHPCISLGLNALETWQNTVSEFAWFAEYAYAWVVVIVVIHKPVKMCAQVCKCDCLSLPVCWLATSLSSIKITYRLSVFRKSFSWKWSSLFFFLLIWCRCWNGCTPFFSWMINQQLDKNHEFKDSTLQKISFSPQITTGKLKSPLPQTPWDWILGDLAQGC